MVQNGSGARERYGRHPVERERHKRAGQQREHARGALGRGRRPVGALDALPLCEHVAEGEGVGVASLAVRDAGAPCPRVGGRRERGASRPVVAR